MSQERAKYLPILRDLNLTGDKSNDGTRPTITSLEVLNHLLETKVLSEDSLKDAVQTLQAQRQPTKAEETTEETKPVEEQKPSLPLNHRTRHISLRFFYDGANYSGLAQNLGQASDNSVEKELFQALLRARLIESREASGYSRCGRTDRGVSAAGQVIALNLKSAIPLNASMDPEGLKPFSEDDLPSNAYEKLSGWVIPRKSKKRKHKADDSATGVEQPRVAKELSEYPFAKILNNLLPPEIRILGWAPVSTDFSARFSATTRTYRYFFAKRQLDLNHMRQGLELMVGRHDFRNFCKMDVEKVYNFERRIHAAKVVEIPSGQKQEGLCYVQIHGQAFLWHQIRCIMEVLFMVGNGHESPDIVTELLNVTKYPGKPSYDLAREKPLVLHDCGFPNVQFGYSVQNVWSVSCQLEQQWEELVLAAARIRNCIDNFQDVSLLREDVISFASAKLAERDKKLRRVFGPDAATSDLQVEALGGQTPKPTIPWKDVLPWLVKHGLVPDANGLNTAVHVPLLQRSMGTTYEEKVEALKKSDKKWQKFEDNIIKKRKTAEEDRAFYEHMTKQGGKGI